MQKSILIFCLLLHLIACSKSINELEEQEQEAPIQTEIVANQSSQASNIELQDSTLTSIQTGVAYFVCEHGPYYFNIDSLDQCSTNEELSDSLISHYINDGFSSLSCNYAVDSTAIEAWTFYIERGGSDGNLFIPVWQDSTQIISSTELSTTDLPYDLGSYYFHNAQEIILNCDRKWTFLFFNYYIGGCFHDAMIWKLETSE